MRMQTPTVYVYVCEFMSGSNAKTNERQMVFQPLHGIGLFGLTSLVPSEPFHNERVVPRYSRDELSMLLRQWRNVGLLPPFVDPSGRRSVHFDLVEALSGRVPRQVARALTTHPIFH